MNRPSFLRSILFAVAALLISSCTTGPKFIPDAYLDSMAASQFSSMKKEVPISSNPAYNQQVTRVGTRVAEVVSSELPNAQWEFVVFEDEALNAFAMPGGKIGVYTGLLELCESDDELAAVMGHEVAHVLLEHANQRMSMALIITAGQVGAAYASREMEEDKQKALLAAIGLGAQLGVTLPFSRGHESQADERGIMIAARAGYNPQAAISFWEKMAGRSQGAPPEFLSTHPAHGTRIRRLKEAMPEAMEIYRGS